MDSAAYEKKHPTHRKRIERMIVRRGKIVQNNGDSAGGIMTDRPDLIIIKTGRKCGEAEHDGNDDHCRIQHKTESPQIRQHELNSLQ